MPLYFHNPGHLDIRGATIAGLSAKDTEAPIGYFGTGLKYAIACILRWGGEVVINSGAETFTFSKEPIDFRGTQHEQIVMRRLPDGRWKELGFTTSYGRDWQPWQVFRELLANARDEGGDVSQHPVSADTVLQVSNCPQLEAEFANRNAIILPASTNWLEEIPGQGRVLDRPSNHVYYRGVRVADKPTRNTYNLLERLDLTEDRTVKQGYQLSSAVARLLSKCNERTVIYSALTAPKGIWEHDALTFNSWNTFSQTFLEVAAELYQQDPSAHRRLEEVLKEHRPDAIKRKALELTTIQLQQLRRACRLVSQMGYPVREHEITVADLGSSTLGLFEAGQVYLDPKVFQQGTKQVVSTLYEELVHKHTGLADCTYAMQTHLFTIIVSLHEEHVFKEPC